MEKEIPLYEYKSQLSRNVADLDSMIQDMKRVLGFLKKLKDGPEDDVTKHACFTASLITYRRCFKHGARARISYNEVISISENAQKIYDYIIAQADKFAAHSVNSFETPLVGVAVEDGKVTKVVVGGIKMDGFGPSTVDQFGALTFEVLKLLQEKFKKTRSELLSEAQKRPVSQIERAGRMRTTIPGPEVAHKKRDV